MTHWSDYFRNLGACEKALVEAQQYATAQEFWDACEHPDWMLWGWARLNPDNNFYLACCDIAEWSLSFYEDVYPDDDRPRKAIEARRAFLRGEITAAELKIAANAADVAWSEAWSAACSAESAWSAESAESAAGIAARIAAKIAAKSAGSTAEIAAEIARNAGSAARIAAESAGRIARNACSAESAWSAGSAWIAAESTVSKNLADIIRNRQPVAPALP